MTGHVYSPYTGPHGQLWHQVACGVCGYEIRAIQRWQADDQIATHVKHKHPEEET